MRTTAKPTRHAEYLVFCMLILLASTMLGCRPDNQETPDLSDAPAIAELPVQQAESETQPASTTGEPEPTTTPTPLPTFNLSSVEDWGSGQLVFDISERSFGDIKHQGIYLADLVSGEIQELIGEGFQLLDLSPEYQQLLVSNGKSLLTIQLDNLSTSEISDSYFQASPSGAVWDKSTNAIYFVSSSSEGTALRRYQPSTNIYSLVSSDGPISVLYSSDDTVVWGQGSCDQFGDCNYLSLIWSAGSGEVLASRQLKDALLLPCQTGLDYVYAKRDKNDGLSFHIQSLAEDTEIIFWSLNTEYADCAWSPNQREIAVTLIDRGWYSGVIQQYHLQILKPEQSQILDLSFVQDVMDRVTWSPDGKYIAYTGTTQNDSGYRVGLGFLDTEEMETARLENLSNFQSESYLSVNHLFWLPQGIIASLP